jgi:hypothetical protein
VAYLAGLAVAFPHASYEVLGHAARPTPPAHRRPRGTDDRCGRTVISAARGSPADLQALPLHHYRGYRWRKMEGNEARKRPTDAEFSTLAEFRGQAP